jgi:uncharacterized protein (TIGR03437 family)
MLKHYLVATLLLVTAGSALFGAGPAKLRTPGFAPNRYIVILNDPPVAEQVAALKVARGAAAETYRQQILGSQTALRTEIEKRNVHVIGAVQRVLNAVFVAASRDEAARLRALPGVKAVVPARRYRRMLSHAVLLTNVNPGAWSEVGGVGNAGAGRKIAILDTGIDQTHPAFQDPSLKPPANAPGCNDKPGQPDTNDCSYTNSKVIVARSYVAMAAGIPPDPASSTPDDVTPRDHVGHGTAVAMVAAGETNTGPLDTITGVAPKAFLGNYRVFGSPGINDYLDSPMVFLALDDAVADGMDVAVLSFGGPAYSGPLDQGAICGNPAGAACDPFVAAVENAISLGMMVVVAAGNDGANGYNTFFLLSSVDSPGTAPSAISVGATTNSHELSSTVDVQGQNVPSNLQAIAAVFGDGPVPSAPVTAPLRDVTPLDGTGLGCSGFPAGSLTGTIALIARGTCYFSSKVLSAQTAGAVGVILTQTPGQGAPISAEVSGTSIPEVMVGDTDGASLRSYLASSPGLTVVIDPTVRFVDDPAYADVVADFSSHGPSIDMRLKPEVVAVGQYLYMATQNFDPNGEMYDPTRYIWQQGTSFSTPMVAGAVALVKQQNPSFTPWQLKSAVVNTATQNISEGGYTASAVSTGNGLLNGGSAVQTTVTVNPAAVSFGALVSGTTPPTETLTMHYSGSSAATLTLSVVPAATDFSASGPAPTLSKTSLSVAPGQADQTVTLTLPSSIPAAGIYEGGILIQGAGSTWRVPYIYVVGDGAFSDVAGSSGVTDGTAGQNQFDDSLIVRLIDGFGVPLAGYPISFTVVSGGGSVFHADTRTNAEGVAGAGLILGPYLGIQVFDVNIGTGAGMVVDAPIWVRPLPVIAAATNAASFAQGSISPGSYIALFGSGLSDYPKGQTTTAALPLAILFPDPADPSSPGDGIVFGVSVSFDVPSAGISVPGRMIYVSPSQINLQVPWELAGQQTVEMKVTVGSSFGQVYTAQVANYSPAVYVIPDAGTSQPVAAAEDLTGAVISSLNPAHASQQQTIQLYLNGLGPVTNPPAIGFVAQSQPLSSTLATPTVTIGGVAATWLWSGLTPTESGLYQINLSLAANTPTGTQPLVVSIGGVSSPPVNIVVQ